MTNWLEKQEEAITFEKKLTISQYYSQCQLQLTKQRKCQVQ